MPAHASAPQLITLGRLALLDGDGVPLLSPDSLKLLALLAYLAAAPQRRATRERLIDLFWADSALPKARNALRQSLHKLRDVLGDELLTSGVHDEVILGSALSTDRDAFLDALGRGDLDAALSCYHGAFAPGIVSAGSAGFEHWADHERERLHEFFAATAEAVGRQALAQGDSRPAQALALRLLTVNPLDEQAWRLRLEAEAAAGNPIHVTSSIGELRRRLADEQREPELRTRQLLDQLTRSANRARDANPQAGLVADLVGRQREFSTLYQSWQRATQRHGVHVHLMGRAGLGKTRLLDDFALRLRMERARVATVRITPRQRLLSYSALGTLVSELSELGGATGISDRSARILVDLQPTMAARFSASEPLDVTDSSERHRVRGEALDDLLAAVGENGPFCVVLDDMHWWDPASRDVIGSAIERLASRAVLVVTAARPGAGELTTPITHAVLPLDPLDAEQVTALVLSLGTHAESPALDRLTAALLAATDGVPLLLLEALRLGIDRALLGLCNGEWQLDRLDEYVRTLRPGTMVEQRIGMLSATQRSLLLLIAVAERPIRPADVNIATVDDAAGAMLELERQGMLVPEGGGWTVAHDTVAEAAIALGSAEARRAAHVQAGIVWAEESDDVALRTAMTHFVDAADRNRQGHVAVRWVQARRAEGDRRPARHIVGELLGPQRNPEVLSGLLAAMPRSVRRTTSIQRFAVPAGGLACVALACTAWWWSNRPPPEMEFALLTTDEHNVTTEHDVGVGLAEWEGAASESPLVIPRGVRSEWQIMGDSLTDAPIRDPSGRYWAFSRLVASNGVTQLMVRGPDGTRAIAPGPGDNVNPSWAPDGSAIAFQTTRYPDGGGTFDLAIVEIATGSVRRLTATRDAEIMPKWSPDGSRIAFLRNPERLGPNEICWITVDARTEHCFALGKLELVQIVGWLDAETILFAAAGPTAEETGLHLLHLATGAIRVTMPGDMHWLDLSGDARWIAGVEWAGSRSDGGMRLFIAPADNPGSARSASVPVGDYRSFWRRDGRAPFIDRVKIEPAIDTIPGSTPMLLTALGETGSGETAELPKDALHWNSSDTTVASIDDTGLLRPHADGAVTITVTAGGWRSASVSRIVIGGTIRELARETWSRDWQTRWTRYGDPLPKVVTLADGSTAMFPNGDDTYSSGAYTIARFDPHRGLAIEMPLKTPITRSWLQRLHIGVGTIMANGHDGAAGADGCSFQYPAHEGGSGIEEASGDDPFSVAPDLADGHWYTLRIQIFPDGTCGVSIDGKLLARGTRRHSMADRMGVVIDGQTYLSQLLVGPVTVWEGVPPGVDWSGRRDSIP